MPEFKLNGEMFGRYAKIPTGFSGELHVYKVIGLIESNSYCDAPITGLSGAKWHEEIVPVLKVVHCGVSEEDVIRVALKDCVIYDDAEHKREPCYICDNARINDELTDSNDFHYHTVGDSEDGFRVMIGSGAGRPLRILFEQRRRVHPSRNEEVWMTVGIYEPSFCPNCGRELWEYGGQK